MPSRKLFFSLLKKFKWGYFWLGLLTFLTSYLSFLIRFNLRTNLYRWENRGKFYYLFGNFSVTQKVEGSQIFVNWHKLLLILFLLYFPLKIIIWFSLNYFQKCYERKLRIHLTKKALDYATKNKEGISQKTSENVYIINQVVPRFSYHFFALPLNLFAVFLDLSGELFSLAFLIRTSSNLSELVPLIISFLLVNLVWLTLFYLLMRKNRQTEEKKRQIYQKEEEIKIKIYLENLNADSRPVTLSEIHNLLDKNSPVIFSSLFSSTLAELPNFIIPGTTILFLFLYYQIWWGGVGSLDWNAYFLAYNLQRILSETKRSFTWLNKIPDWQKNYQQINQIFKC